MRRTYYAVCTDRGKSLGLSVAVCMRGHRVWKEWTRCLRCEANNPKRQEPYGVKLRGDHSYWELCQYRTAVFELDYVACAYGHQVQPQWSACMTCKYTKEPILER